MEILLNSERQRKDPVVPQPLLISRDQLCVCGGDVVAKSSSLKEVLEVRRVLLIPEQRRDTKLAGVGCELAEGLTLLA